MGVLRDFRRAADALERVAASILAASRNREETGDMMERLDQLERERTMWQADVEALLLKAEGKLQAANNAEARTRTMKRSYERFLDPLDPDSDEAQTPPRDRPQSDDAPPFAEEELLPMRVGLETNTKAHAVRAKWGMSNATTE